MNIFDPNFNKTFELFSTPHIVTIIFIALLWIIIPMVFKKLKNEKADTVFRYTLAALLILQQIGWLIWEIATERFTVQMSLPFNLCDLSNILCAVILINKNFKIYEVLYFWALAGTIQSYITPNIYYAFPHFEFFVFYIQHGGEILTILYLTIVSGLRPTAKSILKSLAVFSAYFVIVYIINLLTNSNYMFLMADTPNPSTVTKMISIFGEPPMHLIGLGIITILSHLVLYSPFAIMDKIKKNKQE
jgi:hypothetical integral membrane protein (TIGR02206 family)